MELWMPCPRCGRSDRKYSFNVEKGVGYCFVCGYKNVYGNQVVRNEVVNVQEVQDNTEDVVRRTVTHIHMIYSRLFDILDLKAEHAQFLTARGFPLKLLRNYRSIHPFDFSKYFMWHEVCGVPGFYNDGIVKFISADGILIPCKSQQGLIRSLQIRHTDGSKKRYSYVSSKKYPGGTKAMAYPHWVMKESDKLYLTEGPLKADLASEMMNNTFCAIPGVNNYVRAVYEIFVLNLPCIVALDMDMYDNVHVMKAFNQIVNRLKYFGIRVYRAKWDSRCKGIDDALVKGARIYVEAM